MEINLNKETIEHFERVKELSIQATDDVDESYSSRAAAQTALSAIIRDLVKSQAEIVNMDRLLRVEQALIEAAKEIFPEDKIHIFTEKLAELLDEPDS